MKGEKNVAMGGGGAKAALTYIISMLFLCTLPKLSITLICTCFSDVFINSNACATHSKSVEKNKLAVNVYVHKCVECQIIKTVKIHAPTILTSEKHDISDETCSQATPG